MRIVYSISSNLSTGTYARLSFDSSERQIIDAEERAYEFVPSMPG